MKNEKYIFLRKRVHAILFGCYFLFCVLGCYDYIEYVSYKADYILVNGVIETFEQKNVGRYSHDHTIIRVDLNGLSHRVKANRRYKDKIGQMVQIAIKPLEDREEVQKGVWTRPFLAYKTVYLGIGIVIATVLYFGIREGFKLLNIQEFR